MSAAAMSYVAGSAAPARLRLVVPGLVTERERVLRFVIGACRAHELSADVEEAVVSAVSEAFNHAVLDSYAAQAGTVTIELEVADSRIGATVRDRGAGPRAASSERRTEHRYGLFIMLRAMDEVRWWRDGDENIVAMVKRRASRQNA
jgi:anti-sigma regulatory factor (Ser/Thr protein kinase)